LRDLSLHLLDLLENSIAAGASTVWIRVVEHPDTNLLEVGVEDDGKGLKVTPEQALDPFYTTKKGKRTGLGLSLLQTSAEQAGGSLVLQRSLHGGLKVTATLGLDSVDRIPLGDVATTLSMIVCTHPELELICELRVADRKFEMRLSELAGDVPREECDPIKLANLVTESIRQGQQEVGLHG
jgi:anti-sigma regulatory factor (Ser/Thr protein kinase)